MSESVFFFCKFFVIFTMFYSLKMYITFGIFSDIFINNSLKNFSFLHNKKDKYDLCGKENKQMNFANFQVDRFSEVRDLNSLIRKILKVHFCFLKNYLRTFSFLFYRNTILNCTFFLKK